VEGAGGLLTPLDATRDFADLARALALPVILVARDQLGVLSHTLTCAESARARGLHLLAVILSRHPQDESDLSRATNARILEERLQLPVRVFPSCPDDDPALARTAERAGLLTLLHLV
jgi:dethiobiotin synthetase